jgi:hypothetical protein
MGGDRTALGGEGGIRAHDPLSQASHERRNELVQSLRRLFALLYSRGMQASMLNRRLVLCLCCATLVSG